MYNRNSDFKMLDQYSRPQSRIQFLPEIPLYQQFRSLQNIPNTSRAQDAMISGRYSDQLYESQTQRVIQSLKDKKVSFNQESPNLQRGLLRKIDDKGISTKDNSQPKSILKRKGSNSSRHSDIFDFFESVEVEQQQVVRNNKHVTLAPLQCSIILSPKKIETVSPKRVSFNRKIQVKIIGDDESDVQKSTSRHIFRRQLTDFIN
ncbi:unnamed protein product [Paramecium octaurelia]|uniref:Uncharacterized protein n=1 Tax=Paramecium octaurelia TaxID=43137 RepID=A0A8S1VPW7_PAROT|nr:unnamed protein product [Paramecium octaurelia]